MRTVASSLEHRAVHSYAHATVRCQRYYLAGLSEYLSEVGRDRDALLIRRRLAHRHGGHSRRGVEYKHGSCHPFRHTCATLKLDNGGDVRYVAELLGHAKLETTMVYTRVSLQRLREVHRSFHPAERPPDA